MLVLMPKSLPLLSYMSQVCGESQFTGGDFVLLEILRGDRLYSHKHRYHRHRDCTNALATNGRRFKRLMAILSVALVLMRTRGAQDQRYQRCPCRYFMQCA